MTRKITITIIAAALALSGCAATNTGAAFSPLIDGNDRIRIKADLHDCQAYAKQVAGAADRALAGAVAGAVIGGLIRDRSGLAAKHGITVLAGVIDADYRGELKVILAHHGQGALNIQPGERIAQLVVTVCPDFEVQEVEDLSDTERGSGGFGSTGTGAT